MKRSAKERTRKFGGENKLKSGGDVDPLTVFFVPRTPGGELCRMLRSAEENMKLVFSHKIKIVERAGVKLSNLITSSNPWKDQPCTRTKCNPCQQNPEGGNKCRDRNILYTNTCIECKENGKQTVYVGESARSGWERLGNHISDSKSNSNKVKEKSHMYTHHQEVHPEETKVDWSFKVIRKFQSCFYRMISEPIHIRILQKKGVKILNKKDEYSRTILPQLEVSIGGKLMVERNVKKVIEEEKEREVNEIECNMKKRKEEENHSNKEKTQKKRKLT